MRTLTEAEQLFVQALFSTLTELAIIKQILINYFCITASKHTADEIESIVDTIIVNN